MFSIKESEAAITKLNTNCEPRSIFVLVSSVLVAETKISVAS